MMNQMLNMFYIKKYDINCFFKYFACKYVKNYLIKISEIAFIIFCSKAIASIMTPQWHMYMRLFAKK